MAVRYAILIGTIGCAYAFLVFHLYDLQVLRGRDYLARAESQYIGVDWQVSRRGSIYFTDRHGNSLPVATVASFPFVYAVPELVEDIAETSHRLAPLLDLPVEEVQDKLEGGGKSFTLLQKRVPKERINLIEEANLPGIYLGEQPARFYPFGSLAAHVVGFVGPDDEGLGESGRYGLEYYYDDHLKGKETSEKESSFSLPDSGEDLYLTLEPNVQKEAERILGSLVSKFEARAGLIMVMEPQSGKLLALAGEPTFDPNHYGESDLGTFLNPATQKIYEPGSIFKVLTMAAGIDGGKITAKTTYEDKGYMVLNGRRIQNWDFKEHGPYGRIDMTKVIERSVNTGAIFAEKMTGHSLFTEYIQKFGLGDKTGIDLPGEVAGDLGRLDPKKEPEVAFATASFGQGVAVTPLALLSSVAAIANDGVLMRPYVNSTMKPEVVNRVISEKAAAEVAKMMENAVDVAKIPAVPGYSLAGKTGTAFIPDFNRGGYTEDVFNTYIGFGPTPDPQFIILVRLEKPKGAPLAGLSVVPAFRELAQFIITYYEIPPDRLDGAFTSSSR